MDICTPAGVKSALAMLGVRPSKALGQNFIADPATADRLLSFLPLPPPASVLEIGPGVGGLTSRMLAMGYDVRCVELDERLADHVEAEFGVEVVRGDAVRCQLPEAEMVVSNLPYSASSHITIRLLERPVPMLLTFQREVAERIVAPPRSVDYSRLTVAVRSRAAVERVAEIPPSAFVPVPEIASTVLRFAPAPKLSPGEWPALDRLLRVLFTSRRKKISSVLRKEVKRGRLANMAPAEPRGDARPEELTVEEFVALSRALSPLWTAAPGDAGGDD